MTIDVSDNNPRINYSIAEGVTQTVFSVPFEFFEDSNVYIYVDGVLKTEGLDYTLTGGDGSTGTLTFVTATPPDVQQVTGAAGGTVVTLVRHVSLERVTDFVAGQDINRAALNEQLDTIVAQIADLGDRVDRTIHLNDSEVAPSMLLTDDRKGRVMAFNSLTGAVEAGPLSNDILTIADSIDEILGSYVEAASAAASATAAATSASAAQTAQTAAELAETNAETAEANAETAETNAQASALAALASETAAAASETAAASSASSAASSASSASASADAALAALDNFDDRYLGQKASDPTLDNDGDALVAGALYFNTTDEIMKVFDGNLWVAAYASLSGAMFGDNNLSDVVNAAISRTNLGLGTGDSPTFAALDVTGTVTADNMTAAFFRATNEIRFEGNTGSDALIQKNASSGRDELQIYAAGDANTSGSRGAGMQLYGNYDNEHDGNIAFITGPNDQGEGRMFVSGWDTNTHVTIGNGPTGETIWEFVDNHKDKALLNLINPTGGPALFIMEANGTNEGDITVNDGENMQFGHWNYGTNTYTHRMSMTTSGLDVVGGITAGNSVGIGTTSPPSGNLQISATYPTIVLDETNTDAAYQQTQFGIDGGSFRIQTRTSTNAFVSNDYLIDKNSSGATDHIWRIADSEAMRIDSTGIDVTGTVTADGLTVDTNTLHVDATNQRVGIGTNTPNNQLNIEDTGDVRVAIKSTGTGDADATLSLDSADAGESVLAFYHDGVLGAKVEWFTDGNPDLNITTEAGTDGVIDLQPNGVNTLRAEEGTVTVTGDLTVSGTVDGRDIAADGSKLDGIEAGGGGTALELFAENPVSYTAPTATGDDAVAIGDGADATGNNSFAIGTGTTASGGGSLAIGWQATATTGISQAIGAAASGAGSQAVTGGATAIGGSYASGSNSFAAAIANNSSSYGATGNNSVAMGNLAKSSGSESFAFGSTNTHASGTNSVAIGRDSFSEGSRAVAIGGGNASSQYSHSFGYQSATPTVQGHYAYASGRFSSVGDAQQGTFVLRSDTTDATPESLTTRNQAAGTTNQVILPNNSAYAFHGTIVAREQASAGTDCAAWKIEGLIRREGSAGTTVLVNSATTVLDNTPAWGMALSADTTNGGLKIEVTGAAATNIRWVATINTSEVTY